LIEGLVVTAANQAGTATINGLYVTLLSDSAHPNGFVLNTCSYFKADKNLCHDKKMMKV
jgi:hypothetical protein